LGIDRVGEDAVRLSDSAHTEVEAKVEARKAARERKDWKESDRIRDELLVMGVTLKDNKDGTTSWEVKR
jgi:cysteinyl-tRNA synthetase